MDVEVGVLDCSLNRSLALRPGSALWVFSAGRDQLSQLPHKAATSTRTEIFRCLFIIIIYLLSDIQTARRKKTIL
jgi:hypothetical protein